MYKDLFFSVNAGGNNAEAFNTQQLADAQAALLALSKNYPKAAVRAINASLVGTKTDMKAIMREKYNFKAATIASRITVQKATNNYAKAKVISKGYMINLTDVTGTRQIKSGVRANLRKDKPADTIPVAFIQQAKSGKKIVLRRPLKGGKIRYGRYGPAGSGGLVTISGKKGDTARLEYFMTMHPEFLYNTRENWQRLSVSVAERIDKNITREIAAEERKLAGKWG